MGDADLEATRARLRAHFPPLVQPDAPAFLDNAAGSLVPSSVVAAVAGVLTTRGVVNALPGYAWGQAQARLKDAAHAATGLFVNAPRGAADVVLGPSATALAFRLSAAMAKQMTRGDAIVVSELEHECNASPWREIEATRGVELRVWRARWPAGGLPGPAGGLHVEDLAPLLADGRVKLVALTAASNCFGLATQCVAEAARAAHAAGALICVDAVHGSPHALPDVQRDEIDFLLFSPYKLCAPHLGGLYIRGELIAGLDVPSLHFYDKASAQKFEYGTAPYECLAGWIAALEYFAVEVGGAPRGAPLTREALRAAWEQVEALEAPVKAALLAGLGGIAGVTVYGAVEERERVGTVAFRVAGVEPAAAALRLGAAGVCVGNGHFYATMCNEALQLMPHGVLRASIAHYTSLEDVARLLQGIREMLA